MDDSQEMLDRICTALGFQPVLFLSKKKFRWALGDREGLGPQMIKIERELQALTGHPIDLRVQAKQDKNKRFDRNYLRGVEKI